MRNRAETDAAKTADAKPANRKSVLADRPVVTRAKARAAEKDRSLRRIRALGHQDMTIYEDRESGERRRVPNKFVLSVGAEAAFELAARDKHFEYDDDDLADSDDDGSAHADVVL